MKSEVWYTIQEVCNKSRYSIGVDGCLEAASPLDLECIALECASDYYDNHDGWEDSWPLHVRLFSSERGPEVATFRVGMESMPSFHVYGRQSP